MEVQEAAVLASGTSNEAPFHRTRLPPPRGPSPPENTRTCQMLHKVFPQANLHARAARCIRRYASRAFAGNYQFDLGKYSLSNVLAAEGDILILRPKQFTDQDGLLTKPLSPSTTIHTHRGTISHTSLIGLHPRDIVTTSKGIEYRVHEPTLAEYVRLSKRLVTPVHLP